MRSTTCPPLAAAQKTYRTNGTLQMASRLQNRLALAQFKTKHGWEDLALDTIEPKVEEELRRKRHHDGDVLSDSSSSTSDFPYPTRALMSSPLKAPFFSDGIGSSAGSTGHRKRSYMMSFDHVDSSPTKRFRQSPTPHRSFTTGHTSWKDHHQLAQSSPLKPRRQQHFTTSTGPDVSFFAGSRQIANTIKQQQQPQPPNYTAPPSDEDEDDLLPPHSFRSATGQASPPRTPPTRTRPLPGKKNREKANAPAVAVTEAKPAAGEEGADLLLYLAASPSPATTRPRNNNRMDPPSTPPPKNKLALPSSMMNTPGGGNPFLPNTPGLGFDFADFVHMTPSPAQKPWKTPLATGGRTPLNLSRRRLTFEDLS